MAAHGWLQRLSLGTKISVVLFCCVPAAGALYSLVLAYMAWSSNEPNAKSSTILFLCVAAGLTVSARWFWSMNLVRLYAEFGRMAVEDGVADLFGGIDRSRIGDSPMMAAQRLGLSGMIRAHHAARS